MKYITVMALVFLSFGCKTTTKPTATDTTLPTTTVTTNDPVSDKKKSWSCKEIFGNDHSEVVRLDAYPDEYMGEVYFDGEYESATYRKDGLKRYWNFGEDGRHQIQIRANGTAYYHDFSNAADGEKVDSELTLECKRI
ncbi:hypothetical protein RI845_07405 [Thalassotalea nanhaiensis]|uniref:C-type lysozyme inhibitor domain-containing protein n=1 Tax=Thalassotalea nanhaiensis TaxID=3065648 RepID=A0ABY9TN25_9GAMM|nr:hypothetical protein RI845_07405 [Colwelliaceae bacterium SQ345]